MRENGVVSWLHSDNLGSASMTTDASGAKVSELRYTPFGGVRYAWNQTTTDRKFTGYAREDAIGGIDFAQARFYDSVIGRFLSADTIYDGGLADPQGLNRYSYVKGHVMNATDPSGHAQCSETCDGYTSAGGSASANSSSGLFGSPPTLTGFTQSGSASTNAQATAPPFATQGGCSPNNCNGLGVLPGLQGTFPSPGSDGAHLEREVVKDAFGLIVDVYGESGLPGHFYALALANKRIRGVAIFVGNDQVNLGLSEISIQVSLNGAGTPIVNGVPLNAKHSLSFGITPFKPRPERWWTFVGYEGAVSVSGVPGYVAVNVKVVRLSGPDNYRRQIISQLFPKQNQSPPTFNVQ